jgi:hypothetical protein
MLTQKGENTTRPEDKEGKRKDILKNRLYFSFSPSSPGGVPFPPAEKNSPFLFPGILNKFT